MREIVFCDEAIGEGNFGADEPIRSRIYRIGGDEFEINEIEWKLV